MVYFWASSGDLRVGDAVLHWFSSFLWGSFQLLLGERGGLVHSLFYVGSFCAQHSSPILFDIYMHLIGEVIHRINYQYTDDYQLYICALCQPSDASVEGILERSVLQLVLSKLHLQRASFYSQISGYMKSKNVQSSSQAWKFYWLQGHTHSFSTIVLILLLLAFIFF